MLNAARGMDEWFFPRSPTGLYTKGKFKLCEKQLHGWLSFMRDVKGSAITLKQKQLVFGHHRHIVRRNNVCKGYHRRIVLRNNLCKGQYRRKSFGGTI